MAIQILYQDDAFVAIAKPSGWVVHRSPGCDVQSIVLQALRRQLGRWLYPVHRLDRGTSGVLLMALSSRVASLLADAFADGRIQKEYMALVRGCPPLYGRLHQPIFDKEVGYPQPALTTFSRVATTQPLGPQDERTQVYSLVDLSPRTGRNHQLRRHMRDIHCPIVGDKNHGSRPHNNYFRDHWRISRLILHSYRLRLEHPLSGQRLKIEAPLGEDLVSLFANLGLSEALEMFPYSGKKRVPL